MNDEKAVMNIKRTKEEQEWALYYQTKAQIKDGTISKEQLTGNTRQFLEQQDIKFAEMLDNALRKIQLLKD